jgi:hypothetical protein
MLIAYFLRWHFGWHKILILKSRYTKNTTKKVAPPAPSQWGAQTKAHQEFLEISGSE